jgi:O-antigen/teichoic acid export membrane protein
MPGLIKATVWSSVQRFGGLVISFISNIVLARLLNPEDYGIVGLIMVFIGLADVLVDGGFGNALIQKKDVNKDDISTVFTSNMVISIILFLSIFISAPAISSYVAIEKFDLYLRVEAFMILLRALYVVNFSMLNKEMQFRKLASISLGVNAIATCVSITLAYWGCGVWSLIIRNLIVDLLFFVSYYIFSKVSFSIQINLKSFKELFGFGLYVAVSNIISTLYSNILSFILGKKFSVKELGYYNQAYSLEQIPVYSITAILNQVFFPYLSKEQNNLDTMKKDVLKSMQAMSFFIYPMMVYLICFAKPIIVLLYSEKWLPSVPFFQILCFLGFTNFIIHLNRSILKAIGKPKVLLYTLVIGFIIGLGAVILAIPYGIKFVVIVVTLNSIIGVILAGCFAGKYIHLNLIKQLKAVMPNFILSFLTGILCFWLFKACSWHPIVELLVSFIMFSVTYLLFQYLLKTPSFRIVKTVFDSYNRRG